LHIAIAQSQAPLVQHLIQMTLKSEISLDIYNKLKQVTMTTFTMQVQQTHTVEINSGNVVLFFDQSQTAQPVIKGVAPVHRCTPHKSSNMAVINEKCLLKTNQWSSFIWHAPHCDRGGSRNFKRGAQTKNVTPLGGFSNTGQF